MATAAVVGRREATGRDTVRVGLGLLLARGAGLARQVAFARFFGTSAAADALGVAFRVPNLLLSPIGEGVLSAALVPVQASLLARGDAQGADRVAGTVGVV